MLLVGVSDAGPGERVYGWLGLATLRRGYTVKGHLSGLLQRLTRRCRLPRPLLRHFHRPVLRLLLHNFKQIHKRGLRSITNHINNLPIINILLPNRHQLLSTYQSQHSSRTSGKRTQIIPLQLPKLEKPLRNHLQNRDFSLDLHTK